MGCFPSWEGSGVGFGAATRVIAAFLSEAILAMTSSASGASVVVMTGTQECKEVRIKKEAVDPEDVDTLEDLVRAATTDALAKSKQLAADKLGGLTGGLKLPGM